MLYDYVFIPHETRLQLNLRTDFGLNVELLLHGSPIVQLLTPCCATGFKKVQGWSTAYCNECGAHVPNFEHIELLCILAKDAAPVLAAWIEALLEPLEAVLVADELNELVASLFADWTASPWKQVIGIDTMVRDFAVKYSRHCTR